MKEALKARINLDWSHSAEGEQEDRGLGPILLSDYEIENGLGATTQTYPAFEKALRARLGLDQAAHADLMAEMWEGVSMVAAAKPYAQLHEERSHEFMKKSSEERSVREGG